MAPTLSTASFTDPAILLNWAALPASDVDQLMQAYLPLAAPEPFGATEVNPKQASDDVPQKWGNVHTPFDFDFSQFNPNSPHHPFPCMVATNKIPTSTPPSAEPALNMQRPNVGDNNFGISANQKVQQNNKKCYFQLPYGYGENGMQRDVEMETKPAPSADSIQSQQMTLAQDALRAMALRAAEEMTTSCPSTIDIPPAPTRPLRLPSTQFGPSQMESAQRPIKQQPPTNNNTNEQNLAQMQLALLRLVEKQTKVPQMEVSQNGTPCPPNMPPFSHASGDANAFAQVSMSANRFLMGGGTFTAPNGGDCYAKHNTTNINSSAQPFNQFTPPNRSPIIQFAPNPLQSNPNINHLAMAARAAHPNPSPSPSGPPPAPRVRRPDTNPLLFVLPNARYTASLNGRFWSLSEWPTGKRDEDHNLTFGKHKLNVTNEGLIHVILYGGVGRYTVKLHICLGDDVLGQCDEDVWTLAIMGPNAQHFELVPEALQLGWRATRIGSQEPIIFPPHLAQ